MIQDYLKVSLPFKETPTFAYGNWLEEYVHYFNPCCLNQYAVITDRRHLPPFQFLTDAGLGIDNYFLVNADTEAIVAPTPTAIDDLILNRTEVFHGSDGYWYIYEGLEQLNNDLPEGRYFLILDLLIAIGVHRYFVSEVFWVCDFTADFMESDSFDEDCHEINDSQDLLMLEWWSDCDFDDIIYQQGYRNRLYLDTNLEHPIEEITKDTNERLGEMLPNSVVVKKKYKFNILIPEFVWNALIRLPIYGSNLSNFHATLTTPQGDCALMSETDILGEWIDGNCVNKFTVQFMDEEYPVVGTNCCEDLDISIV